ncbi:MAG: alpha/beta hydrolase [Rubripirellula sp.]
MKLLIHIAVLSAGLLVGDIQTHAQQSRDAAPNSPALKAAAQNARSAKSPTQRAEERPAKAKGANAKNAKAKKKQPKFQWVNPLPKGHDEALHHGTFRSPSLGVDVGYAILLPDGYDESTDRYPVVYYLHGGRPGSEAKSHRLAAKIRATRNTSGIMPAIYVFVNGGPVSHYNMPDQPTAQGADVFIKELIPHVDATYRTIADRRGRALEGFSQGGRGTMRLSLRHPDVFCSAAAGGGGYETEKRISESGGAESETLQFAEGDNTWDLARRYASGDYPKVNWMIYVGTKGFNYENNLDYMAFLDSQEIPYQRLVVPGVPHSATGIYEKEAERIMRFHAANFADANE